MTDKLYSMASDGSAKETGLIKAITGTAEAQAKIVRDTAEFLSRGNSVEVIPHDLFRTAEELGLVASSQHTYKNPQQQKLHNANAKKLQGARISLAHQTRVAIAEAKANG